jgi:alkylation response protein AidB-like acyl-CoA dehydrogenase
VPKHAGLSYFVADMHDPGVEVRPLRQLTGEAEFNEVFLTDVRIPDASRLGNVGEGWRVATATLMNERVAIGNATSVPREENAIRFAASAWREQPELRTHELHQRLLSLWAQAEIARLAGERLRQQLAAGEPGPEGSAGKLTFARLNQEISGFEIELLGDGGLTYDDWSMRRAGSSDWSRSAAYRYLRAKGNSIEGGTSEILRNIIAERVLRLPAEPRTDTTVPWKDLPR